MAAATIISKGQITIPVRVRAALGVEAGDRLEFVELKKGQFAIVPATRSLKEIKGMFRDRRSKPVIHRGNGFGDRPARIRIPMIGLDTNVIVRYLTHDDPIQTSAAVKDAQLAHTRRTRIPFAHCHR